MCSQRRIFDFSTQSRSSAPNSVSRIFDFSTQSRSSAPNGVSLTSAHLVDGGSARSQQCKRGKRYLRRLVAGRPSVRYVYCTYGLRVRSCFINRYLGGKMAAPTPDVCSIIVELVLLHFGRENRENGGRVYYVECHAVISTHLDLLD